MSEQRLVNLLESQFNEADTSVFEVGEQREKNHRYYTLEALGNEIDGRSHYISPDVFDTVETKKAYFTEVFLSGREAVRFSPTREGDQMEARKRTAYVNLQLELNKSNALFRDCWHDAFVAKRCVVHAEWREDEDEYVQNLTPMPIEQALQLFDDPKIIDVDTSKLQQFPGPQGPMVAGEVTILKDSSQVFLTLCQPERYFRDPNVSYVWEGVYAGYEEDVSRAELIERGFDAEVVRSLRVDYRFRREEEDNSRKAHDRSWTRRQLHQREPEQEEVTLYHTYTWLDMSQYFGGEGQRGVINEEALKLYKIQWSQGRILEWSDGELAIEEATEIPFFEWTEHKISHAEHGLADADVVAHTQKTQSTLKRLVIDNQQMRNTTRWEAVQGAIKNPRELLDNPIGGVVWTKAPGSVQALATPELSPLTFQVIEMLDRDKEERSGQSRLAKGMNSDVVRYQNAADMVERLTNAANRRILRACRDFAKTFLVPLSQYIYRLGARHDRNVHYAEVAGEWMEISPGGWPDVEMPMKVMTALTPDEGQRYAQVLLMMHQTLLQDPHLQMLYGMEQKHSLMDDTFEALGVPDSSPYMLQPRSEQVQMMLKQQQEMQRQQQEMQMAFMQSAEGREWYKQQLDGMKLQVDAADKATDNELNDEKFEWQKKMDVEELEVEKQQRRPVALGGSANG